MVLAHELLDYLDQQLVSGKFSDYAPNGLQIEGRVNIKTICTAVTASYDVIQQAIELGADALIVHHGYFWRGEDPALVGMKYQRINALIAHQINLFAYHLPLDCHPQWGNNYQLGLGLGLLKMRAHRIGQIDGLLWTGALPKPLLIDDLMQQCESFFKRRPVHLSGGHTHIQTLAWCTGAAQQYLIEAKRLGVDAYLSGEVSERTFYEAKELAIDYFSCGHHATERLGVQALGEHLALTFDLNHYYLDTENPI